MTVASVGSHADLAIEEARLFDSRAGDYSPIPNLNVGLFFGFFWAQFGHRLSQTGAKTRQKQAAKVLKAKDEQL
jgi:hypothetical protein